MTLKTMRNGMALGVIAVLTIAAAQAQSETLSVTVPFDYSAGGKVLPAGEYKVQTGIANGVILLRNLDQGATAMMFGNPVESNKPSQEAKLVFHRYGDSYFLSEIWASPGTARSISLRPSRAEREQIAKLGAPTTVGLTASR